MINNSSYTYYYLTLCACVCVCVCVCVDVCIRVEHRRDGRGAHGSEGQCRAAHADVGALQRFELLTASLSSFINIYSSIYPPIHLLLCVRVH